MVTRRGRYCPHTRHAIAGTVLIAVAGLSCERTATKAAAPPVLRIGSAQLSTTNPMIGVRQLAMNQSFETLVRAGEDGHIQPSLAESWREANDGRSVVVKLRPGVMFHDGTPLDGETVAGLLPELLRASDRQLFDDVERIAAVDRYSVEIAFKRRSRFLLESLEVAIRKKPLIGTGPFQMSDDGTELKANDAYYLGRPGIARITVANYPNVRSAWAEMLRDQLDMLYEVGGDALESLQGSNKVRTFTFVRHYQYVIALNARSRKLMPSAVRRALNEAIDRPAIIRDGLRGHGVAAASLMWPRHWAFSNDAPQFKYDPSLAASDLKGARNLTFTCLVRPEATDERLALAVRQQLSGVGVTMNVQQAPQDKILQAITKGDFDALLIGENTAPTMFRVYEAWHTQAALNIGHFGTANVDRALDAVRDAVDDDQYRAAIHSFQQASYDDPPAILLAWDQTTRAVSTRFTVASPEPGRDILSTLRLWKPNPDVHASRN